MELRHTSQSDADFIHSVQSVSDRAAGGLIIAKDTGNILIAKRSESVENPNKFGIFGGRFDDFETPDEALEREIFEETGYPIYGTYKPLGIFYSEKDDFAYHTHIAFAPTQFEPELNWEHTSAEWISLEALMQIPKEELHHGVSQLLDNIAVINELKSITEHYSNDLSAEPANDHENDLSY